MDILITTASWKAALTAMVSLGRKGHRISLISSSAHPPVFYSKYCAERLVSPQEKDKAAYMDFLFGVIKRKKYDLLIPISDTCVRYFSERFKEITRFTKIILPSPESAEIACDKNKTYRFAYQKGIHIPTTYFPSNGEEVEKVSREISFPCVVKMPQGFSGKGNFYPQNREELLRIYTALPSDGVGWPVVQEFIKGSFYGFTAVCSEGKVLGYFIFEVLRQYPKTGGVTVYAQSLFDQGVLELSVRLIEALRWTGPIDLDIFLVPGRGALLLEINPRFSGTIPFAYLAGVDLPGLLLDLFKGRTAEDLECRYRVGARYRAVFQDEVFSCLEDKRRIVDFAVNFLRPNTLCDFSSFDRSLLWWQIKQAAREIKVHCISLKKK